jgi:DUF4097 and DUF4098 domain-containing protein YvlB
MFLSSPDRRVLSLPVLALSILSITGCDIVTADLSHAVTAEWRKTYTLEPGGRVEVTNVNGRIRVEPSAGNEVVIVAEKKGKGVSDEAARQAIDRIEIKETVSNSEIRVETRTPRVNGVFGGSSEVSYAVRVPAGADVRFRTVNGGIELSRLTGRIHAETTNGGITAREVGGPIDASTTNGGVDVDLARMPKGGVTLGCTNGGIKLRLPAESAATISARVTNGGIDADGLSLDTTESTRRSLQARLNGGGAPIRIEGTNGGINIAAR